MLSTILKKLKMRTLKFFIIKKFRFCHPKILHFFLQDGQIWIKFLLKYDFLANYSWFRQIKQLHHTIILKFKNLELKLDQLQISWQLRKREGQEIESFGQKALIQNFYAPTPSHTNIETALCFFTLYISRTH